MSELSLNDIELGTGYITMLSDIIPTGIFDVSSSFGYAPYDDEFLSKFRSRYISSFYEKVCEKYKISETEQGKIVISGASSLYLKEAISSRFKEKWQKLYNLLHIDYNPLNPFDITLEEDSTDTLHTTKDKTEYKDDDVTYAFNSEEPVPTDTSAGVNNREYSRENPKHREYRRYGNIGNITKQKLLDEERRALNYQTIETIYNDIASVICRNSYKNY